MTKGPSSSTVEPPFPREHLPELEEALGRSLEGWEDKAPRYVSPPPGDGVEGAWFDVAAVARVVNQLRAMPHTKGRWRGTPFEPEAWQVVWILAPVFGWKDEDGLRIVSELWDEIPRKNGKTTLSARLGIVLLTGDGEWGAEVYAAAGSKDQADFMFAPARDVALTAPALKGRLEPLTHLIRAPRTGGIFRVLSKAGDLAHGANVHAGLIDEIHVHKDRGLIDAIDSGTGAREQPLIIYTTTANDGEEETIYGELHGRALKLANREIADPSTYVVIWCADPDDDPFAEETIRRANPNYPISPSKAYIARKVRKAKDTPSWYRTYLRLHLNIRSPQAEQAWTGADVWSEGVRHLVDREALKGHPVWLGLVASASADLTAIAVVARAPEAPDVWWGFWRWFMPEEAFESLVRRTESGADAWRKEKRLELTEGNVIDVARHTAEIRDLARTFDAQEVAYDPNGAIGIVSPLFEELEDRLVPLHATNPGSSLTDWERLLASGQFFHGGDPIAAWQVRKLRVKEAATGVLKIDRKLSTDNVSGIAAMELALRRALLATEPVESAYASHDLRTV